MVTTMKDFTVASKPDLEFTIGEDVFYAVGDTPGGVVLDLAEIGGNEDGAGRITAITDFLNSVLLPESADLFDERLHAKPGDPKITFTQAISVFEWLLEEYTGSVEAERPTRAAGSSSSGSRRTGRSSTASARSQASTPVEVVSDAL